MSANNCSAQNVGFRQPRGHLACRCEAEAERTDGDTIQREAQPARAREGLGDGRAAFVGTVGALASGLHGLGVLGAGIVAGVAGVAARMAVAKTCFSDVADPVRTSVRAGAEADRRLGFSLDPPTDFGWGRVSCWRRVGWRRVSG